MLTTNFNERIMEGNRKQDDLFYSLMQSPLMGFLIASIAYAVLDQSMLSSQISHENLNKIFISIFIVSTCVIFAFFNVKPNSEVSDKMANDRKTDPVAIVSFAAGLVGFIIMPIIFVPIGYIASIHSYYRLKENKELKGSELRIIGAILTTINILWLMYQYQIGFMSYF